MSQPNGTIPSTAKAAKEKESQQLRSQINHEAPMQAPAASIALANGLSVKRHSKWTALKQKLRPSTSNDLDNMEALLHDAVTRSGIPAQRECWLEYSVTLCYLSADNDPYFTSPVLVGEVSFAVGKKQGWFSQYFSLDLVDRVCFIVLIANSGDGMGWRHNHSFLPMIILVGAHLWIILMKVLMPSLRRELCDYTEDWGENIRADADLRSNWDALVVLRKLAGQSMFFFSNW